MNYLQKRYLYVILNVLKGEWIMSDFKQESLDFVAGKIYGENYERLLRLYKAFLLNYSNLNNTLNFQDPMDIFVLYSMLLHRGYLSLDKLGEKSCYLYSDIDSSFLTRMAPLVFTGDVSSHSAAEMFLDILLNNEIMASTLAVKFDCIVSNHVIVLAIDNDKKYFFDPMNFMIFLLSLDDTNTLFCYDKKLIIGNIEYYSLMNVINDRALVYEILFGNYACANLSDFNRAVRKVERIFDNNIDVFEQFYNENAELYEEASDKVLCLYNY